MVCKEICHQNVADSNRDFLGLLVWYLNWMLFCRPCAFRYNEKRQNFGRLSDLN